MHLYKAPYSPCNSLLTDLQNLLFPPILHFSLVMITKGSCNSVVCAPMVTLLNQLF